MKSFTYPREGNPMGFSFLMNLFFALIFLWGGILCLPSLSWAASLFAKQDGVKVTAEKSPTSKVLTTLNLGDAVTVLSVEGRLA